MGVTKRRQRPKEAKIWPCPRICTYYRTYGEIANVRILETGTESASTSAGPTQFENSDINYIRIGSDEDSVSNFNMPKLDVNFALKFIPDYDAPKS